MPKIDMVNQQYNSSKFEFDATGLGVALGNTISQNGQFRVNYTSGIFIVNTATGGISLTDYSTSGLYITKQTATTGGLSISDGSSGNLLITKSYAGSMALTQTSVGTFYIAMAGSGDLQIERTALSTGDLNLLNSSIATGDINIKNVSLTGKIVMETKDKITSDADIEVLDTDKGMVMTARWTDATHTVVGSKKFRIFVELDDGTISTEEV